MRPYDVEFFDMNFNFLGNTNVDDIDYSEDYLSADENNITVFTIPAVKKYSYIRIKRGNTEHCGIVSGITVGTDKSKQLETISYKPLMELFNTDIIFDTKAQGSNDSSLEGFIKDRITESFINNTDSTQNIKGLSVITETSTTDWQLHITPSVSGGRYNIVNLLSSVIILALKKYRVRVKTELDVQNKTLVVRIGIPAAAAQMIETDLAGVIRANFTIKEVSTDVNKLVLYDKAGAYTTNTVYFLHNDLSYDTSDKDRIMPVICEMRETSAEEGGTFKAAAQAEAANVFSSLAYKNLIEICIRNDDPLIRPDLIEFGQEFHIRSGNSIYKSILTGIKTGKTTTLIFGTIRVDLTKLLKGGL